MNQADPQYIARTDSTPEEAASLRARHDAMPSFEEIKKMKRSESRHKSMGWRLYQKFTVSNELPRLQVVDLTTGLTHFVVVISADGYWLGLDDGSGFASNVIMRHVGNVIAVDKRIRDAAIAKAGQNPCFSTGIEEEEWAEAFADPGQVVRCMILDMEKMFLRDNGVEPTEIDIPIAMEALLEAHCYHGRELPGAARREAEKSGGKFFGLIAHWDKSDFVLY